MRRAQIPLLLYRGGYPRATRRDPGKGKIMKRNLFMALLCLLVALVIISCDEPKHEHAYGTEWKYDETNHWHVCECGEKSEIAAHTFGEWKASSKDGKVERKCTVCEYVETADGVANKDAFTTALGKEDVKKIVLTDDIDLANDTEQDIEKKSVEIDLNGHTLTVKKRIRVKGASLTLSGKGTVKTSDGGDNSVFWVYGSTTDQQNFTVLTVGEGITIEGQRGISTVSLKSDEGYDANPGSSYGVVVNLKGTTINASVCGLYTNGKSNGTTGNVPVFNLDNVKITQTKSTEDASDDDYCGIYAAGYAVWNIKNTTINASNALSLKSGEVTIDGGTYKSTGKFADPSEDTSNGSVDTGAALSMTSNDGYAKKLDVVVNSGKFISENGYAVYEGIPNDAKNNNKKVATASYVTLVVNGGEFVGNSDKGAVKLSEMTDKKVLKGGVYSSKPEDYIAEGYEAVADGSNWKVVSKSE